MADCDRGCLLSGGGEGEGREVNWETEWDWRGGEGVSGVALCGSVEVEEEGGRGAVAVVEVIGCE